MGKPTKKPRFTKCVFFVFSSFLASHRGDIRARVGKPRKNHVLQSVVFSFSCLPQGWHKSPFGHHICAVLRGSTLLAKSLMTSAILGPHVLLQDLTQAKQIEVQCIRAGIVWMSWWVQGRKQIDTVPTRARNYPCSNQFFQLHAVSWSCTHVTLRSTYISDIVGRISWQELKEKFLNDFLSCEAVCLRPMGVE